MEDWTEDFRHIELLMVESAASEVTHMVDLLAASGVHCNLTSVADGAEALDYLYQVGRHADAVQPDVIFVNPRLQGVDAAGLVGTLKRHPLLRQIPIMFFNAAGLENSLLRLAGGDASYVLPQPLQAEHLTAAMTASRGQWGNPPLPS